MVAFCLGGVVVVVIRANVQCPELTTVFPLNVICSHFRATGVASDSTNKSKSSA